MVSQRVGRVPRLEATGEPVRVKNHSSISFNVANADGDKRLR